MPHERSRHLESLLRKSLKFSPLTGVFGHRQVGKTTLCSRVADSYVTLDVAAALNQAETDPEGFLNGASRPSKTVAIDECQMAPPLFPALKEWVRVRKNPGQFLLTGSVRFSSRKAIRESLTGRLVAWELLPMTLSETHSASLSDALVRLIKAPTVDVDLKYKSYFSDLAYENALSKGGLPGVCFVRDAGMRDQKFENHLSTMLERDLQLILQTTLPYALLKNLLASLAQQQSLPVDFAVLSRQTRISVPTIKKLLIAFEAMFLIRLIKTEGTEVKPVVFLEDQGEATFLAGSRINELNDLLRFCFAEFRTQFKYRADIKFDFFQYRNRGGAQIPLAIRVSSTKSESHLGVVPLLGGTPGPHDTASALSFLKKYKSAKVIFVTRDPTDRVLSKYLRVIPLGKLV